MIANELCFDAEINDEDMEKSFLCDRNTGSISPKAPQESFKISEKFGDQLAY